MERHWEDEHCRPDGEFATKKPRAGEVRRLHHSFPNTKSKEDSFRPHSFCMCRSFVGKVSKRAKRDVAEWCWKPAAHPGRSRGKPPPSRQAPPLPAAAGPPGRAPESLAKTVNHFFHLLSTNRI